MYTDPDDDVPETTPAAGESAGEERALERTTDHDVIRQWAEDRHATPAAAASTDEDVRLGALRFDLDLGNDLEDLEHVGWDEWFVAFDERGLTFVYEEDTRPDGSPSNYFHLEASGERR